MVEGQKKAYTVYLDESDTEYVKSFLERTKNKGGLSGVVNGYMVTMASTLRAADYKPRKKVTAKQLLKVAFEGLRRSPA